MKNRKVLAIIGIMVLLSLSFSVYAGAESIGRWLDDSLFRPVGIWGQNFGGFAGVPIYDDYYQIIDFMIFLILFVSISSIALKKAFAGDQYEKSGSAIRALAIIIGLALALAALKAGLSVTFFIPFVTNALFFICIIIVYFLLLRMGMDKHKIMAFILALVITYLLFNIVGMVVGGRDISIGTGQGISVGVPKIGGKGFLKGIVGGGLKNTGILGEDCSGVPSKLDIARNHLDNTIEQVNQRKISWGFTKEDFITYEKLDARHHYLDLSEEDETAKLEIKKYLTEWEKSKKNKEKWKIKYDKCEAEGKLPKKEKEIEKIIVKDDELCIEYSKNNDGEWSCYSKEFTEEKCVKEKCYGLYLERYCCRTDEGAKVPDEKEVIVEEEVVEDEIKRKQIEALGSALEAFRKLETDVQATSQESDTLKLGETAGVTADSLDKVIKGLEEDKITISSDISNMQATLDSLKLIFAQAKTDRVQQELGKDTTDAIADTVDAVIPVVEKLEDGKEPTKQELQRAKDAAELLEQAMQQVDSGLVVEEGERYPLSIYVFDKEKGHEEGELKGVEVILYDSSGKEVERAETDKNGEARFENILIGAYKVTTYKKEYAEGVKEFEHKSVDAEIIELEKGEAEKATETVQKEKGKVGIGNTIALSLSSAIILFVIVIMVMRYAGKSKGKVIAADVKKITKKRKTKIDELGELLNKKRNESDSLEKEIEGGVIKNA